MGIALQELLELEAFDGYHLAAGAQGLHREVQGITVLEAPDGYQWFGGRELVLTSGYPILQDPDCIRRAFEEGSIQKTSGLMIKRGRYIHEIPQELTELFDRYGIPLITMPFEASYMQVMNEVNVAVMNRTIRRFRIHGGNILQPSQQTYKVQKIQRILQALEGEMNFPAFLFDLTEQKGYYSSANFKRITELFGLTEQDYWEPSRPYTRHVLCDYIHMDRLRLINPGNADGPRVSWILIPIIMDGVTQAYFVVMESREFLDYYDETSIRIGFLMLQAVYEQIMVAQNVENAGFENFILFALNYHEKDKQRLMYQANIQGISLSNPYIYAVFRQTDPQKSLRENRRGLMEAFLNCKISRTGRIALLDENEGLLLLDTGDDQSSGRETVTEGLDLFRSAVAEQCGRMQLEFGFCMEKSGLEEIQACVGRCRSVLSMGRIIYPEKRIWDYEMLGPLAWLRIPEDELGQMLAGYRELLQDERNAELLRTLKLYLENNMNYSITADKLYLHINTVRKRLDKVRELLHDDWEDPVSRMKTVLLLQFLEL